MWIHTFQGNPIVPEVNTADKSPAIQTFLFTKAIQSEGGG